MLSIKHMSLKLKSRNDNGGNVSLDDTIITRIEAILSYICMEMKRRLVKLVT